MKEDEIRNMLSDIINNDAEYECRHLCGECDYKRENCDDICPWTDRLWGKYHLGDEIRSDYEYRKVQRYVVIKQDGEYLISLKNILPPETKIYFESTSEKECEEWIAAHNTWMEKNYGEEDWVTDDIDANRIRVYAIKDFVKEFLSMVYKDAKEYNLSRFSIEDLKNIIKEIGVA